jgi:hypothetical protein
MRRTDNVSGPQYSSPRERGVSDLVGFTLMFSIIIMGVGLVSLAGVTQLSTLSEAEEVRGAERGMENTAATLEDMHQLSDSSRTKNHLPIKNGLLYLNQTNLNITSAIYDETIQINALEHRFQRENRDITLLYEGGGVFRSNGAAPRYAPSFKCRNDSQETVAIISVVNLTLNDSDSGFARAKSRGPNSALLDEYSVPSEAPITNFDRILEFDAKRLKTVRQFNSTAPGNNITVWIDATETGDPLKWDEYFGNLAADTAWNATSHGTIKCKADRTLIRITTIEIDFKDPDPDP